MSGKNTLKVGFFKTEKKIFGKFNFFLGKFGTKIFRLPFGDQGLISRYYYFKLGAHTKENIMEDLEFILRVPKKNRILFNSKISTSFRKFEKNGILLQGFIHLLCQSMFLLNLKNKLIYKVYNFYDK